MTVEGRESATRFGSDTPAITAITWTHQNILVSRGRTLE